MKACLRLLPALAPPVRAVPWRSVAAAGCESTSTLAHTCGPPLMRHRLPVIDETQTCVHLVCELYLTLLQQGQPARAQRLTLHP
jgi:hypothetical protein